MESFLGVFSMFWGHLVKMVIGSEELKSFLKSAVAEALKEQAEQRSIEPGKKYLTRSEASELLRISLVTLDKRIHDGTLTAKKIGNRYLISAESVDKALAGKLRRA